MNLALIRLMVSGTLEVAGLAAITWGLYQWTPVAGWIAGGLSAVIIGLAADPPTRTAPVSELAQ